VKVPGTRGKLDASATEDNDGFERWAPVSDDEPRA
jgi:hypothetical protein